MNSIISVLLFCVISLAVWLGVYSIWGAGNNNFVGRYFSTDNITYVVQHDENTGFQNSTSGNEPDRTKLQETQLSETESKTAEASLEENTEKSEPSAQQGQVVIVIDENGEDSAQVEKSQDSVTESPNAASSVTVSKASESVSTAKDSAQVNSSQTNGELAFQSVSQVPVSQIRKDDQKDRRDDSGRDHSGRDDSDSDIRASEQAVSPEQKKITGLLGAIDTLLNRNSSASIFSTKTHPENSELENSGTITSQQSVTLTQPELAPGTTIALDVKLIYDSENCHLNEDLQFAMPIVFREGTSAIKGYSLTKLDKFVSVYRRCANTLFTVHENIDATKEDSKSLRQRRLDEVVYYLLHMRVSKADIQIPERS